MYPARDETTEPHYGTPANQVVTKQVRPNVAASKASPGKDRTATGDTILLCGDRIAKGRAPSFCEGEPLSSIFLPGFKLGLLKHDEVRRMLIDASSRVCGPAVGIKGVHRDDTPSEPAGVGEDVDGVRAVEPSLEPHDGTFLEKDRPRSRRGSSAFGGFPNPSSVSVALVVYALLLGVAVGHAPVGPVVDGDVLAKNSPEGGRVRLDGIRDGDGDRLFFVQMVAKFAISEPVDVVSQVTAKHLGSYKAALGCREHGFRGPTLLIGTLTLDVDVETIDHAFGPSPCGVERPGAIDPFNGGVEGRRDRRGSSGGTRGVFGAAAM